MDIAFLHNESAGDEEYTRAELTAMMRAAGYRPVHFELKSALKTPEVLNIGDFVAVAGGDGSIRHTALHLLHRGRPIAPLPLGTANNIARSLGLKGTPEEIIGGWAAGHRRKFDVGIATGPWGRREFIEGAGVGLIARSIAVIEDIDEASAREFKTREDKLHRDHCVFAALSYEVSALPLEFAYEGKEAGGRFLLLEVLNIGRAGPGLELAPEANPSDGWFDVVSAKESERAGLEDKLKDFLAGAHEVAALTAHRAREVRLVVPQCELRIDDDLISVPDGTKVAITIQPSALEFLLPG